MLVEATPTARARLLGFAGDFWLLMSISLIEVLTNAGRAAGSILGRCRQHHVLLETLDQHLVVQCDRAGGVGDPDAHGKSVVLRRFNRVPPHDGVTLGHGDCVRAELDFI